MASEYIIYCDESDDKGEFYSNFYGGCILRSRHREAIERRLGAAKRDIQGEAKWTKISQFNEDCYTAFIDAFFDLVEEDLIKVRVMFTQNLNSTDHVRDYEEEAKYYKLYYQFIKHAFGLMFCNQGRSEYVNVTVFLDDAPDTKDKLENFKNYIASLSHLPEFFLAKVQFSKQNISEVNSRSHVILQAVDVVLGAIQFKLNEHHRAIPQGQRRRGKRTRAKERVYKHINVRIRSIYPSFNIGATTGHPDGPQCRWTHRYRHWCFKPAQSVPDRTRGKRYKRTAKRKKRAAPQRPT